MKLGKGMLALIGLGGVALLVAMSLIGVCNDLVQKDQAVENGSSGGGGASRSW